MTDAKAKKSGDKRAKSSKNAKSTALAPERVVVAIPKGRVLKQLAKRLAPLGVDADILLSDDRTLVRDDPRTGLRFLLLKPDDVPTYVEYGAADLGIVGRDILLEREYDLYAPLDLGIGICRMVVAGKAEKRVPGRTLRVATKFTNIASRYFLGKGQQVDLVYVQGSVELAPLTGLADVIVDLVESGETLRQNGLQELELICPISSVVVANRVALKLKRQRIAPLLEALQR
ncbi:MAG TPA: ATP phosphoribosyltransferase [Polyangiales bacterium]|jgi:ATP phosphoribosyltransferase|nr:ATP phosphoribosyltransferase [Polyangiales bacterium]